MFSKGRSWRSLVGFARDRFCTSTLTFQDVVMRLGDYWACRGCIVHVPFDCEVGADTMCLETFLRVLGPEPFRAAYVQPSRRSADGRYSENPHRLYKHMQQPTIRHTESQMSYILGSTTLDRVR